MGNTFRIVPFINVYKAGRYTIAPALVFIKVYKEVITSDILYSKQFKQAVEGSRESAINSINQDVIQKYLLKDITTAEYHELLEVLNKEHNFKREKADLRYYAFGHGIVHCLVDDSERHYYDHDALEFTNGITSRERTATRLAISHGHSDLDMLLASPTNRMFINTRDKLLNFDFSDEDIATSLNVIERDLIDLPQLRAEDRIHYVKITGLSDKEPQIEQYK